MTYTVNVRGNMVDYVSDRYHAYHANGVTAVEIPARDEEDAREIAESMDLDVLYVFL